MSDETYSFSTAKSRLEEIVVQVRKKDTSLEKSLDLLEEGVRLANACTELIDHADWTTGAPSDDDEDVVEPGAAAVGGDQRASEDASVDADAFLSSHVDVSGASDSDAEFAADDDAYGDSADEVWADPTPDFADEEVDGETVGDA